MYLSKAALVLSLGLVFASCSKHEPLTSLVKPNAETKTSTSSTSTTTETIQFAANLGFNDELRGLEGTKFYRGRLRPKITGGSVQVKVYLGSKASAQLSSQELTFKYDEDTNTLSYRGNIAVPQGLLGANDLRLLMLVANDNQVNSDGSKLDITNTIKTDFFDNNTFADGTALAEMKVPYSTGWIDVSGLNDGDKLDVARKEVTLKPLGHVIKLDLDVRQTVLEEIAFKGFKIESTAITDKGAYALPQNASEIGDVNTDLPFTPVLGSKTGLIGSIDLSLAEEVITKDSPKTKTVFVWVEKIPATSLKAAYATTANSRWTRTFVLTKYTKPVMDPSFAAGGWNGTSGRNIPAYYSTSDFSKKGSTMSMLLDNPKVVSPIDRIAYSYAANQAHNGIRPSYGDDTELKLVGIWGDREKAYTSMYSYTWLASQNFIGDTPQNVTFASVGEPNSRVAQFRIPTLDELAVILPTQSVGAALRIFNNKDGSLIDVPSERVKLGNAESAPTTYSASYKSYRNLGGLKGGLGVRFKGGDDRYKAIYQYREVNDWSKGTRSCQVQTLYLGSFYPEIQNPDDYKNFASRYPDATQPPTTSERILPQKRRENFQGNTYWVRDITSDQATYLNFDQSSSSESIMVKTQDKTDTKKHTVIVIRDL